MPYDKQPYQYNDRYTDVGGYDPTGGFNLGHGLQSLWGSFTGRFKGGKWDRTMPQGSSFDIASGETPFTSPKMPTDMSPSFGERMDFETSMLPGPSGLWGKGQRQFASEQGMEAGRGLLPGPKGTYEGVDYKDFPALQKEIMSTSASADYAPQTLRTTQSEFLSPLAEAGESVPGARPNLLQRMGLKYKRGGWGGEAPSSEALKSYFVGSQPEVETAGMLGDLAPLAMPGFSKLLGAGEYTGSAAQNTQLMSIMKKSGSEGVSIVDALKAAGSDSGFASRSKMYGELVGTAGAASGAGIAAAGTGVAGAAGAAATGGGLLAGLATGANMLSTAMPYLQAGMMIAQGVAGHRSAKRQLGLIGGQENELRAAGKSLEALYGQRSDIYEQQFGEQIGQSSYGAGQSLLDIKQTGESVGFTGLSYSGTVSKRLSRAREGVRKQFGFSKTGLENILGEKMMGLEEWKAGQEADIASELARLKYQRKEAEAGSDWNPFT